MTTLELPEATRAPEAPCLEDFAEATRALVRSGDGGEGRLVLCGVTWEQYLELDAARGEAPAPRLYYLDGELEIIMPSLKHDEIKRWIACLVDDYALETDIEVFVWVSTTLKSKPVNAAAEPDDSWCFGNQKQMPDLAVEVALTSGGVSKLEVYRRLGTREVWFWRKNTIEIWSLPPDVSRYEKLGHVSKVLPGLDLPLLLRCLEQPTLNQARRAFREALAAKG